MGYSAAVAVSVFLITYVAIGMERIDRTIVSVSGAILLLILPRMDERLRHSERLYESELRQIERLFGREGHGLEVAVQARDRLKQLGLEADRKVRRGDPAQEILAEIRDGADDLVVLASDGAGRVEEPRLGSVAERVVRDRRASVLMMRARRTG